MKEQYRAGSRRTYINRLYSRDIPLQGTIKSIPSVGVLRGEARALFSHLDELGYIDGIDEDQINSLPPEFKGARHALLTLHQNGSSSLSSIDMVVQELFGRYMGAGIITQRRFQTRMIKAVNQALEQHKKKTQL